MPETVEILQDLGIIQITSFGKVTEDDLHKSRQAVAQICQEHGFKKILVESRDISSMPSTIKLHQHAEGLTGAEAPTSFKFAVVVSDTNLEDAQFIETVARNRMMNFMNFTSREEALAWLNE